MRNLSLAELRYLIENPPNIHGELWRLIQQIPIGHVSTYGRLAEALGDAVATRWVGNVLMNHRHVDSCPCHRVVRVSGRIGNFVTGHPEEKANQLCLEGVALHESHVDLTSHLFDHFRSGRPLGNLRKIQDAIVKKDSALVDRSIRSVAGLDVSYAGNQGFATYVEVDSQTGRVEWSWTLSKPIQFPYLASYLAFRELPLLLALVGEVQRNRRLADVLLVDGSGIAHPRGAGIATMLGIVAGIPTIGITKKLLFGSVNTSSLELSSARPISNGSNTLGFAVLSSERSKKPIFISPGCRLSARQALHLVRPFLGRRRLPDPIYWADRLSRQASRNTMPAMP